MEQFVSSEKFNIQGLFPTPVVRSDRGTEITKEEKEFVEYHTQYTYNNMGNITSLNRYILEDDKMKSIKSFIDEGINYYVKNIICPTYSIQFYITQSWLNYTKPGQFHHKHEHPNSIISGVFYVDADLENDKIFFYKEYYKQISIPTNNHNTWNSPSWFIPVKTGNLVLFPSSLSHMVETKHGENTRCSLAFNVFAKGYLGEEEAMTALHIK